MRALQIPTSFRASISDVPLNPHIVAIEAHVSPATTLMEGGEF